jgi:hypothetical protein
LAGYLKPGKLRIKRRNYNDINGSIGYFGRVYAAELDRECAVEITFSPLFADPCELSQPMNAGMPFSTHRLMPR